jgi:predicted nucleic acid-binding protein
MALPPRLFCDTSFFYACLDPDDTNHERAQELTADAITSATTFVTTWDIISETVTLLRYRLGFRPAMRFLDEIKPNLLIIDYSQDVRDRAEQMFRRRARAPARENEEHPRDLKGRSALERPDGATLVRLAV